MQDRPSSEAKGSVPVVKILCQAYHYMITPGLEFGYCGPRRRAGLAACLGKDANTVPPLRPPDRVGGGSGGNGCDTDGGNDGESSSSGMPLAKNIADLGDAH